MIVTMKKNNEKLECDCGNDDATQIITAPDGEIVCSICGLVLGNTMKIEKEYQDEIEGWSGEADLRRQILENRVSRRGWEF
jgi:hypothetical protein